MHARRVLSKAALVGVAVVCGVVELRAQAASGELTQAAALVKAGKLDEAKQRLTHIVKQQPRSVRAWDLLGTVYLEKGNLAEARKSFERAAGIATADPEANGALAKLYLDAGEFSQSLAAMERIPANRRTAKLLPMLAADYLSLKQPEKAAVEIQAMLNVAGVHPDLVPELAEFFLENGAVADAEELLKVAAARGQKATDRYLLDAARVQAAKGNRAEARETVAQLIQKSPDYAAAVVEAGRLAGSEGDWKQAAQLLSRANGLAPGRADVLEGLASAQLYANRPAAALETAKKLEALRPGDTQAAYFMALSWFGMREWEKARPYAEAALREHGDNRELNLTLAGINYNTHNLAAARKHVDICLKQNSEDPGALYYQGLILKTDGDLNAATQSLQKSLAKQPNNADGQKELGSLCLQTGNLACAKDALEQAATLVPADAQNHYQLALAYTRSGMAEQAKEQLAIYNKLRKAETGPATVAAPPVQ